MIGSIELNSKPFRLSFLYLRVTDHSMYDHSLYYSVSPDLRSWNCRCISAFNTLRIFYNAFIPIPAPTDMTWRRRMSICRWSKKPLMLLSRLRASGSWSIRFLRVRYFYTNYVSIYSNWLWQWDTYQSGSQELHSKNSQKQERSIVRKFSKGHSKIPRITG